MSALLNKELEFLFLTPLCHFMKSEKRKNEHDDYNQSNQIDQSIHCRLPKDSMERLITRHSSNCSKGDKTMKALMARSPGPTME